MAIQWGNTSALSGFQNALALGADIGGAIRQNRENSALAAFMTAGQGTPMGGAPMGGMGSPESVGNLPMPTQWGGNGGGIVPTETQKSESQAAYERLARINPRLALEVQGKLVDQQSKMADQQAKRAKAMQEQNAVALRQKAAQGDQNALYQLVGIDPEGWKALGAEQRQRVKDINEYTGQAGLRISQLQPEQRAAAWDQVIDNGVARGFKELAAKRGQYSEKALNDAIDGAGLVDKFLKLAEPDWRVVPEGGTIVNARDPKAIASLSGGTSGGDLPKITSKADVDKLPPGAQFIAPDGSIKRKGGGVSNGTGGF